MIADDDSTDNSWDVIQSFEKQLEYKFRRADKISGSPHAPRVFSKQHLLEEVRRRFGTKDVWVQIIESDTALLDTDPREAIARWAVDDLSVRWHMVNAVRREWTPEYDLPTVPDNIPLHEYFNAAYWMEQISSYTFRPLPELVYTDRGVPWPSGFSHYLSIPHPPLRLPKHPDSPLILHYGFRSPTFYYNKMRDVLNGGCVSKRYPAWDFSSPESVRRTVPFYSGEFNDKHNYTFEPVSREGWIKRLSFGDPIWVESRT